VIFNLTKKFVVRIFNIHVTRKYVFLKVFEGPDSGP